MQSIILGRSKGIKTQAGLQETINLVKRVREVLCELHPKQSKDQGHFWKGPTSKQALKSTQIILKLCFFSGNKAYIVRIKICTYTEEEMKVIHRRENVLQIVSLLIREMQTKTIMQYVF